MLRRVAFVCIALALFAVPASAQDDCPEKNVVYVPTPQEVVDEMLKLANVTSKDVVYDLGSGDGRIVILAAQKYGARGVGVEIDPKLVAISRENARAALVDSLVTFVEGDLFTADISAASVVTLFLSNSVNRDLEPKLRRELRPGTRIVSHQFPIGRWAPDKTVRAKEDGTDLYLWIVPAPAEQDFDLTGLRQEQWR